MKFISSVLLAGSILLVGCSTTNTKSQKGGDLKVKVSSDLKADLDVDTTKKIVGTVHFQRILGIWDLKGSENFIEGVTYDGDEKWFLSGIFGKGIVEEAKSAAAYKAVVPAKADVIVAPQYIIKVKSYFFGAFRDVTAQVTGYGATIKDIKPRGPRQGMGPGVLKQ